MDPEPLLTPTEEEECPICYEALSSTRNRCTTPCGHTMCFECMMRYIKRKIEIRTDCVCPCCRNVLFEATTTTSDSESIDTDNDDDDESDDDIESEEESNLDLDDEDLAPVERIAKECAERGVTFADMTALVIYQGYRYNHHGVPVHRLTQREDSEYTRGHCRNIGRTIFDIVDEMDELCVTEHDERHLMDDEDQRSKYAYGPPMLIDDLD